ncbi:MAG: biotin/lipoyl-containing protein, partial [Pseudomonadota bacterium]
SRLRQALSGVRVSGPETNARFLYALAAHPAFQAIELDTHFIERHNDALFAHPELSSAPIIAACLFLLAEEADESASSEGGDPWTSLGGWRLTTPSKRTFWLRDGETAIDVVRTEAEGDTVFVINDERVTAHGQATAAGDVRLTVDGQALDAFVARTKTGLRVWLGAERFDLAVVDPLSGPDSSGLAAGSLAAPMPGVVTALSCKPGDKASAGDTLVVMEAMKMEHALHAPSDGVVKAYRFQVGDQVGEGDLLVEFEADEAE